MLAESFIAALESQLSCEFEPFGPEAWSARLPGSRTLISIDGKSATLRVATPIDSAHDGLPADDLLDLLRFNFPNDVARSSFLAGGRAAGLIELVDVMPLASLQPSEAAAGVLDQIAASLAIAEQLAERRTARFSRKGS